MPGAAISVGLAELAGRLAAKAESLARIDWKPALRKILLLMTSAARECFDRGQAPDGTAWLPLKRPSKRRGGPSAKPLRDRGVLMASVTSQAAGHVEEITDTSATTGTVVAYGGWQNAGTRTIPARPFLGWSERTEATALLILAEHAETQLRL